MELRIEKAGNINVNDINCRLRTAFRNTKGEEIYLEFHAGTKMNGTDKYISITHLFRIDNEKERRANNSPQLNGFIKTYNSLKRPYNSQQVQILLETLKMPKDTKIIYCENAEYSVLKKDNTFELGNFERKEMPNESSSI